MTSDDWHDLLRGHAEAIGFVCIKWAWLELVLDVTVAHLSGLRLGTVETQAILVQLDIRDKVETARALAHHKRLSDDWFTEIARCLNEIDNDIRPLRNRVVHDVWNAPGNQAETATRTHGRIRLAKTQSHQPLQLTTHEIVAVSKADIANIANKINSATNQLLDLMKMTPGWPTTNTLASTD